MRLGADPGIRAAPGCGDGARRAKGEALGRSHGGVKCPATTVGRQGGRHQRDCAGAALALCGTTADVGAVGYPDDLTRTEPLPDAWVAGQIPRSSSWPAAHPSASGRRLRSPANRKRYARVRTPGTSWWRGRNGQTAIGRAPPTQTVLQARTPPGKAQLQCNPQCCQEASAPVQTRPGYWLVSSRRSNSVRTTP